MRNGFVVFAVVVSALAGASREVAHAQHAACFKGEALKADVDGDGRKDLVYHVVIGMGAVLGVCTASGQSDRIPGVGMSEVLKIIDVEPDGRDEIFYGGTTVTSAGGYVAVFRGGALHRVRLAGGRPLVWESGLDPVFLVHNHQSAGAAAE